tara:strand:+ start:2646 stop:2804 length:159 start_codon:yes stop_codon:yes gene_type:complete
MAVARGGAPTTAWSSKWRSAAGSSLRMGFGGSLMSGGGSALTSGISIDAGVS